MLPLYQYLKIDFGPLFRRCLGWRLDDLNVIGWTE